MLAKFGSASMISLKPYGANIKDMAKLALDQPECGWTPIDGDKNELAQGVSDMLVDKADMLDDYFSLEVSQEGELTGIPLLLDGYVPDLNQIPMFLLRLATEVVWDNEEQCFETFSQELARFYKVHKISESSYDINQHGSYRWLA